MSISGIAIERPTIPGIVATFATCSGAKSFRTWSIILASAKIRPSVRIEGLYDFGMRYAYGSSCSVGPFHSSAIANRETMRAVDIGFSGLEPTPTGRPSYRYLFSDGNGGVSDSDMAKP